MRVLQDYCSAELEIKKSRFLAEAFVIENQPQARQLLKEQKQKYADATHVVHAFICGLNAEILGCSDDGEPSGTAGRPVLEVLKGRDCTNIMVTVTRWFGGTLLGTGGLVKAYGDSAKEVLSLCNFEEYVAKTTFSLVVPYSFYDQIKIHLAKFGCENISEDFAENIKIAGVIKESLRDDLAKTVFEMTAGKISLQQ